MKEDEEFLKKMENLQVPNASPSQHPEAVKMAIMNAERSAALGVWLIVLPCYFLFCAVMYYFFHMRGGWFGAVFTLASGLDKTPGIDFMAPIVLLVLPIICIIINALAITHVKVVKYGGKAKQFSVTIRLRLWNLALIIISVVIVFAFMAYAMVENISIRR